MQKKKEVTIGEYTIRTGTRYDGKPMVWVEHSTGEGAEFDYNKVARIIDRLYKKHF